MSYLKKAAYCGTGAAFASLCTIALLARYEGRDPLQPINATSHVLWGPQAAARSWRDKRHTLAGLLINVGSGYFWGAICALGTLNRSKPSGAEIVGSALITSSIAGGVDYLFVPKRLRPGWELSLEARHVAIAILAMGAGLAAGGFAAREVDRR
ncbi:hypothetical protein [Aquibaculum sediminis]|uniref:hypothetical protein n=1 Tax=Aquibaculum sediminis TaxID=3231907 RepID=UPI0034546404